MTHRLNCWEFMKCGREPGGEQVAELGECPAAVGSVMCPTNGGLHGGRVCWYVAGTLCDGSVQGSFAKKFENCVECAFFRTVILQEERHFHVVPPCAPEAGA